MTGDHLSEGEQKLLHDMVSFCVFSKNFDSNQILDLHEKILRINKSISKSESDAGIDPKKELDLIKEHFPDAYRRLDGKSPPHRFKTGN